MENCDGQLLRKTVTYDAGFVNQIKYKNKPISRPTFIKYSLNYLSSMVGEGGLEPPRLAA